MTAGDLPACTEDEFLDRILVDCPACSGLAIVRLETPAEDSRSLAFGARRMTCTRCAAHRVQPKREHGELSRPDMGLPLRLAGRGRHGTLYAYNEAHLDHIEAIVGAALRRERIAPGGPRNRTVASRLPAWVKAAAHRDEVLKLIARMRGLLAP